MSSQSRQLLRDKLHQTGDDIDGDLVFDKTGRNPVSVPSYGHQSHIERPATQRFSHGFGDWAQDRLTAREIAMMRLMNEITDKPNWHQDDAVVAQWATEAAESFPLVSLRA